MPERCRVMLLRSHQHRLSPKQLQNTTLGNFEITLTLQWPFRPRVDEYIKEGTGKDTSCPNFYFSVASPPHDLLEYGTSWPRSSVPRPHYQTIHPQSLDCLLSLHRLGQHRLDVVVENQTYTTGTLDRTLRVYHDPSHNKVLTRSLEICRTLRIFLTLSNFLSAFNWPILYGGLELPLIIAEVIGRSLFQNRSAILVCILIVL